MTLLYWSSFHNWSCKCRFHKRHTAATAFLSPSFQTWSATATQSRRRVINKTKSIVRSENVTKADWMVMEWTHAIVEGVRMRMCVANDYGLANLPVHVAKEEEDCYYYYYMLYRWIHEWVWYDMGRLEWRISNKLWHLEACNFAPIYCTFNSGGYCSSDCLCQVTRVDRSDMSEGRSRRRSRIEFMDHETWVLRILHLVEVDNNKRLMALNAY